MSERAVFLSRLEFSILLIAGGIEEIACFPLPGAKEVDERQMIKAVYGLVQEGLLTVEEGGIKLSGEMEESIASMKASSGYLLMESGDEGQPQRMIYPGKTAVILENTAGTGKDFRLSVKAQDEFWAWVEEIMEIPAAEAVSEDEAAELIEINALAIHERELLQECAYPGAGLGLRLWIEKIQDRLGDVPCTGIRFIQNSDGRSCRDLILCQGCANLWFLWCDPDKDLLSGKENPVQVRPDAVETRKEIQAFFWREEK